MLLAELGKCEVAYWRYRLRAKGARHKGADVHAQISKSDEDERSERNVHDVETGRDMEHEHKASTQAYGLPAVADTLVP